MAAVKLLYVNVSNGQAQANINLEEPVNKLKLIAAELGKLALSDFELVYCGKILKEHDPLQACGIKNGSTVHVIKSKKREPSPKLPPVSDSQRRQVVSSLKVILRSSSSRHAFRGMTKPDSISNLVSVIPGLKDDPVALVMLQNPDLLGQLADNKVMQKVCDSHPTLFEALNNIIAVVQSTPHAPTGSSAEYSYNVDGLSDEEDTFQHSDFPMRSSRNSSPGITSAQLSAALAMATGGGNLPSSSQSLPATASWPPSTDASFSSDALFASPSATRASSVGANNNNNSTSSNAITSEMFSNAVEQALNSSVSGIGNDIGVDFDDEADAVIDEEVQLQIVEQIRQLRELGFLDDEANLRALVTMAGDIQAAVEHLLTNRHGGSGGGL